jgi:hypothetical protein
MWYQNTIMEHWLWFINQALRYILLLNEAKTDDEFDVLDLPNDYYFVLRVCKSFGALEFTPIFLCRRTCYTIFSVVFHRPLLIFSDRSCGHSIIRPSNNGFWLSLWYFPFFYSMKSDGMVLLSMENILIFLNSDWEYVKCIEKSNI